MKAWIGKTLVGIGLLHTVFGVVRFGFRQAVLGDMLREGLFNTIRSSVDDPLRAAAFWFFVVGFALMLIGSVIDRLERLGQPLPRSTAWGFACLTVVCLVVIPRSGFWFIIPPAVGMLYRDLGRL